MNDNDVIIPLSENMTRDELMEALARLMFPDSDECQIIQLKEALKENEKTRESN